MSKGCSAGVLVAMLLGSTVAGQNLPLFANRNKGPPEAVGIWMAELREGPYIWMQHSSGYAGVSGNTPGDPADLALQFGTYTSYECDLSKGKGGYKATVRYGGISQKGTLRLDSFDTCEVGKIDLQASTYQWSSDSNECPTDFDSTANLVSGVLLPYSCGVEMAAAA